VPTPISNQSTPHATITPELAPIGPPVPPAPVVTIEPVVIEADAGTQELLKRHAASAGTSAPACMQESLAAAKGGGYVGAGVLATLSGAATGGPIGFAAGLAGLFLASWDEGANLRALYECKKQ
jgi:hypothetical protein